MIKKITFLALLAFLTACSEDTAFEKKETPKKAPQTIEEEMANESFSFSDVKRACEEGCQYDYQLYTVANSLKKEAVSLNKAQLESIKNSCNFFCSKRVFESIKKQRALDDRDNSVGAPVDSLELSEKPQKKEVQKKKPTSSNKELIPFEEL